MPEQVPDWMRDLQRRLARHSLQPATPQASSAESATDSAHSGSSTSEAAEGPMASAPLPHAVPIERGLRQPRHQYDVYHPDDAGAYLGYIIYNERENVQSFEVHCLNPNHQGGLSCSFSRTTRGRAGNPAAGRPLGLMLAWLWGSYKYSSRRKHHAARLGDDRRALKTVRYSKRLRARNWLQAAEEFYRLSLEYERPQDEAVEGIEPQSFS